MAGIEVTALHKRYPDGTVAVDHVDLSIGDGELFVMLGPSGCGKTTTLRAIAGLERQTTGDIRIGDTLVNDLPPAERDIAMVFQFYALYPHLRTRDNLAFPLRAEGLPKPEVEERVNEAARLMRLGPLLDRRPSRLSGGEQQRVALARALVRRPRAFLMDEPLTNLDAELRADMRTEIKHLQGELGTTMVYVTHDQVEAMSLGHRIAILNKGRVEQIGTPLEVYDRPASLFCAAFIGSPPMNLIEVEVADGSCAVRADWSSRHRQACRATVASSQASGRRRWKSQNQGRNVRSRPAWSRRSGWATKSSTWLTTAASARYGFGWHRLSVSPVTHRSGCGTPAGPRRSTT